jgi:hypothetical protein
VIVKERNRDSYFAPNNLVSPNAKMGHRGLKTMMAIFPEIPIILA